MDQALTFIRSLWPVFMAASGFLMILLIVVYYKIPDLTKRIAALEKSDKKAAKVSDIDSAIDGFSTVCKFNQMSCQKEIAQQWSRNLVEFDSKMAGLYDKLNMLMVSNAELVARVEVLLIDRQTNGNSNHIHKKES